MEECNMTFNGFTAEDFDCFNVPGLEKRMESLITHVRPKLTQLGEQMAPFLSMICNEEMYPHVAKHARRKVNPPKDTWVAWGPNKRGYKGLPHFEVGMFESHLFIIIAVIYESPNKVIFADYIAKHHNKILKNVPDHFYWSLDHMSPDGTLHKDFNKNELLKFSEKIKTVKKAEGICGLRIEKNDPLLQQPEDLIKTFENTFQTLLPLYKGSFS